MNMNTQKYKKKTVSMVKIKMFNCTFDPLAIVIVRC